MVKGNGRGGVEQGEREEVYLSERGWAEKRWERGGGRHERERKAKEREGEGTVFPFTLAAFGLRMSCFFFWVVREVFLWRVCQKQSQTSRRTGT